MVLRAASGVSVSLLVLFCSACSREQHHVFGFSVEVATAPGDCLEWPRNIVAIAVGNHKARLNTERFTTFPEVVTRLREVLTHRAERVVFIMAETGVYWGEVLELIDHVQPEVTRIAFVTPQVAELTRNDGCMAMPIRR